MRDHRRAILIVGYSEDVDLVANELASFSGTLHRLYEDAASDESTAQRAEGWHDAIVLYVFSKFSGDSSQLRSLFIWLQHRLRSSPQIAVLLTDVTAKDMVFPEFDSKPHVSLSGVAEWLEHQT